MYLGKKSSLKFSLGNRQNTDMNQPGRRIFPNGSNSILGSATSSGTVGDNHSNQSSHQYLPIGLKHNKLQTLSKNPLEKH